MFFLAQATCRANGDPHYTTFDGKRYNFMGKCEYVLAKVSEGDKFSIIQDNEHCGRKKASCTNAVTLKVKGLNIRVERGGNVTVDGTPAKLPYNNKGKNQYLVINGRCHRMSDPRIMSLLNKLLIPKVTDCLKVSLHSLCLRSS